MCTACWCLRCTFWDGVPQYVARTGIPWCSQLSHFLIPTAWPRVRAGGAKGRCSSTTGWVHGQWPICRRDVRRAWASSPRGCTTCRHGCTFTGPVHAAVRCTVHPAVQHAAVRPRPHMAGRLRQPWACYLRSPPSVTPCPSLFLCWPVRPVGWQGTAADTVSTTWPSKECKYSGHGTPGEVAAVPAAVAAPPAACPIPYVRSIRSNGAYISCHAPTRCIPASAPALPCITTVRCHADATSVGRDPAKCDGRTPHE
jgi:hypothetical protein